MLPHESVKREVLLKRKCSTQKETLNRTVNQLLETGIVNLDKPSGPTSHEVVSHVRKILNIQKAGHSGTLDPRVSGVLPTALNNGTKVVRYLLKSGKEYVCLMHLHKKVDEERLIQTINSFKGRISQLPPVKSAVVRRVRKRSVYDLDILEIEGKDVLFKVSCEAGTYIRKLVHDIGKQLKVGANMQELRRVRVGPFTEKNLTTLQDLVDAFQEYASGNEKPIREYVLNIEKAVEHLPKVWIMDKASETVKKGAKLAIPGIANIHSNIKKGDITSIMALNDELIAIGEAEMSTEEIMQRKKGIAFSLKRVL